MTLTWLNGAVPPAAFLLILWILLEPKCSRRAARWALAGFLAAELALQCAVYALGGGPELALTLLPLTFCLPAIVGAHLLSSRRFVPTAVSWLLALLNQHLLLAAQKLLLLVNHRLVGLPRADGQPPDGAAWQWILSAVLLLAAAGLVAAVFRFFREPFQAAAGELDEGWTPLLFLPVMLLAVHSYFLSSATAPAGLLLLFLTALAALWTLARLMGALAVERRARENNLQLEALRQDYKLLQKKLELGRSYRHDTRHHILALSALLQQGDNSGAQRYVADWQGQLTQVEVRTWCRSAAVNAVLSSYLAQAEKAGCATDVEVSLPEEFPVEELDLCVVLANALENAIQACQSAPEGAPRQIKLRLALIGDRKLAIQVKNSCSRAVEFDSAGFPVTEHREGHGQGLKSIAAVAEKYHGIFRCDYSDGVFTLRVVLMDAAPEPRRVSRVPAVCAGVFLCVLLLNCMPAIAQALELVPVLGPVVRVVDLRSYSWSWGDTGISAQEPVLEGGGPAVDEINEEKDAFIAQMEQTFLDYAARKYQGYVAEDISYEVMRDDSSLFILRFDATLNAGGSLDFHRHIVLDKRTEQVLSLADLFQSEANYVFPISREIKAQMAEQINAGEASYFLSGEGWPEEDCFHSIDPEQQDFYINENGQLVIAFDEYEVAPGSMGSPEFTIPASVLGGILAQPSLLG